MRITPPPVRLFDVLQPGLREDLRPVIVEHLGGVLLRQTLEPAEGGVILGILVLRHCVTEEHVAHDERVSALYLLRLAGQLCFDLVQEAVVLRIHQRADRGRALLRWRTTGAPRGGHLAEQAERLQIRNAGR